MLLLTLAGAGFDGQALAQCLALKVHESAGERLGTDVDVRRPLAVAGSPGLGRGGGAYEILLDHRWQ